MDHDEEGGAVVVDGLLEALAGASSSSWAGRARAGNVLASFAGVPEAATALVGLLLDVQNTAVTRQTAEALVRAGTVAAVEVLARAVAGAGDSHGDWIQTGVHDAVAEGAGTMDLLVLCQRLAWAPEAAIRQGAAELRTWVESTGG
ncbi:HEAT repeat domain-containing protein [Streptomyces sp. NPDC051561]|uniref:HEAT repeat domain-containing protein n=1 Tax=Streptomyces sp. NPDC051561 TaxID=3365658 RepID=UPI003797F8C9